MADTKISALTAASEVTADDLIPIVNDPGGTPATQKATAAQLATFVASTADIAEAARDALGAALTAGANITITVDDPGDTITIAASGGGTSYGLLVSTAQGLMGYGR